MLRIRSGIDELHLDPELLAQAAIGLNSAAQLLLTAGDNPGRLILHLRFSTEDDNER